ncbi:MAG: potassium channel protein [Acidobacteriota bacterium]|nr:MAG: potassium channel protein [Acidobacteriota bacterium]
MNRGRRLIPVLVVIPGIMMIGTVGYRAIEGWDWIESLYMAIITVTTVGFSEVHPLSEDGRVFTTLLILLGVGGITFTFTTVTNYITAGELRGYLKERKMQRVIDGMNGHFVICGFGEMGRQVCNELRRKKCRLVVVDSSEGAVEAARAEGILAIHGDAGVDSVLMDAGIGRAQGLVVATNDDATNLLVVLSARVLRNDIPIVARANLEEVEAKLLRVGADRVLFPQSIVGRRMAQMLLNPEICDFIDVVSHDESLELLLENFQINAGSVVAGKSLRESRIRETTGASIVGLKRPGSGVLPSLKPDSVLQVGDTVFALGTREQVENLSLMIEAGPDKPVRN